MSKQKGFNLIYFSIYNKYRNNINIEYLYASEAPETVKEDTDKNIIQEATQKQRQKLMNQQHKRVSKTKSNKKRTQMKNR